MSADDRLRVAMARLLAVEKQRDDLLAALQRFVDLADAEYLGSDARAAQRRQLDLACYLWSIPTPFTVLPE